MATTQTKTQRKHSAVDSTTDRRQERRRRRRRRRRQQRRHHLCQYKRGKGGNREDIEDNKRAMAR
jgi:hypothetical protein